MTDQPMDPVKSSVNTLIRITRIRPVYFPHKGLPGTLNAVIPMTRGPFIAFMDSDDIALPHRFRVQMDWMEEKRLDLCGVQVESFGSELDLLDVQNGHHSIAYITRSDCSGNAFSGPFMAKRPHAESKGGSKKSIQ